MAAEPGRFECKARDWQADFAAQQQFEGNQSAAFVIPERESGARSADSGQSIALTRINRKE